MAKHTGILVFGCAYILVSCCAFILELLCTHRFTLHLIGFAIDIFPLVLLRKPGEKMEGGVIRRQRPRCAHHRTTATDDSGPGMHIQQRHEDYSGLNCPGRPEPSIP